MKPEKKLGSSGKKQQHHHSSGTTGGTTATSSTNPTAITSSTQPSLPISSSTEPQQQQLTESDRQQKQPFLQKQVFSDSAIRNNFQVLEQSRTCQAAVTGIASGILGLSGAIGFLFYFICVLIQAFIWDYKAGFQWANFFPNRWLLVTHSIVGGLFTYVLFWVFVYGLVHVY